LKRDLKAIKIGDTLMVHAVSAEFEAKFPVAILAS